MPTKKESAQMRTSLALILLLCAAAPVRAEETVMWFRPVVGEAWTAGDVQNVSAQFHERLLQAGIPANVTAEDDKVRVALDDNKSVDRIRKLATSQGNLAFHLAERSDDTRQVLKAIEDRYPGELSPLLHSDKGTPVVVKEDVPAVEKVLEKVRTQPGLLPEGKSILLGKATKEGNLPLYVIDTEPLLSGRIIQSAHTSVDPADPDLHLIDFALTQDAGETFTTITAANLNRPLAMVVDGQIVSVPVIRSAIGRNGQISGDFTPEEAADIAAALNLGPLSPKLEEVK
jgi:preprotein translocase subunit SecD